MRKTLTILVLLFMGGTGLFAQQDAMFTKYMFNSLSFNPAYAGSKEHLTFNAIHRTQWLGIEGAPTTQSLIAHTPMPNERVGMGIALVNDQIGPTKSIQGFLSYAYRIPIGAGKLSVGLQGGAKYWRADFNQLNLESNNDDAFKDMAPKRILPNFGVGLYYYTDKFYVGAASPQLIEYDLRADTTITTDVWAKQQRHYYLSAGAAIPINGDAMIFKPSILVKNVGLLSGFSKEEGFQKYGAPTEFDIDLSLMFYQALWIGTSFRSAIEAFNDKSSFDSADIWAAYYLMSGWRIGVAYDFTLTELRQETSGSFEVMLGYEFDYKTKQVVTPRYF